MGCGFLLECVGSEIGGVTGVWDLGPMHSGE